MQWLAFRGLRAACAWRRPSGVSGPAAPLSMPALSMLGRLRRSRRGAVALTFGFSAIVFLGVAGLATEVGSWYLAHRHGQNAADAAASAGALIRSLNGTHDVIVARATNAATRNGYTSGGTITVTINHPPSIRSNCCYNDQNAVEAIVDQVQTPHFGRLFQVTSETVSSRAVAKVEAIGNACVLALSGDHSGNSLLLSGNFAVNAPNCELASDYAGPDAIDFGGSAAATIQSFYSAGGCSGCTGGGVTTTYPARTYQAPIPNPFASLDSVVWPPFSTSPNVKCQDVSKGATTLTPYETSGLAYCSDLQMANGDNIVVTPGTYFFWNSSIKITGGTLTCLGCDVTTGVGVHIVLLGSTDAKEGIIDINGGIVTLSAAKTNVTFPELQGILFYRQNLTGSDCGGCNSGGAEVTINGDTGTNLAGGFYFPGVDAKYNGNAGSACTVIVGGAIQMNGDATLNEAGCANLGTGVPRTQIVALVE